MVNKTPLADLPSIDEFIVEPTLPSVDDFLPKEEIVEEVQTIEDADGNSFLEVEDVIKAPEWGELVRMVNDVRKDIPEIPEIKDYAPELEELSASIQQVKDEIPVVPEIRYYENELEALKESIDKVENSIPTLPNWIHKVTEVPDFAWVGKGFNVIDEDFRGVRDTISTLAVRVTTELEKIHEESDTKTFETKTDFKTIHERVDVVRKDIFKELREQSTVIWNLQKKLKSNQKEFEITFNEKVGERFDAFSEVTKKTVDNLQESFVESTDNLAKHMDGEVKSLQERIKSLPKPKYYEEDLKVIKKEIKNLTELKALVYDIQLKQKDLSMIQEGILNEPPDTAENIGSGTDPLTPMDQKFATLKDLAEHYRIFINRIQTQLSTMGGGGAGAIKDLDDVDFDQTTGDNKLLIFDQATTKWVGIASTALAPAAETLDQTLTQGNSSSLGMSVGIVTATGTVISGVATFSDTTESTSTTTGALIISGGVGIAKSLFVSGNISAGGTITYEDVTNVDSQGIGTFRQGIKVGPPTSIGSSLHSNGNAVFAGIVTAATVSAGGTDVATALGQKASIGMVLALG